MYGTCVGCVQVRAIRKTGTVREHNRSIASGDIKFDVRCAGSNRLCAEEQGLQWQASPSGLLPGLFVRVNEDEQETR